jgi:hypothetical protein
MSERLNDLEAYRQWMISLWSDRRLTLAEIRALKVFAEVNQLAPEEHETIANDLGVDARELTDEHNQPLADWLRVRRQSLPTGSGGLRYAPLPGVAPWKTRLPEPPLPWQSVLAGLAAFVAVAGLIIAVTVQ